MTRKPNYYSQILSLLEELQKNFPTYNLGKHLSTALDGERDIWGMTDKSLLYALTKYKTELELDMPHSSPREIEDIIKGGLNLDSLLEEDED